MASLRAYAHGLFSSLGVVLIGIGSSLAASIDVPKGGGDIPSGFAFLFSYALVGIGIGSLGLGSVLLDDSGIGSYLTIHQRRFIRAGGGLLLVGAIAPFFALLVVPVILTGLLPGHAGGEALISTLLMVWLAILALGVLGHVIGVGWRIVDALVDLIDSGIPGHQY